MKEEDRAASSKEDAQQIWESKKMPRMLEQAFPSKQLTLRLLEWGEKIAALKFFSPENKLKSQVVQQVSVEIWLRGWRRCRENSLGNRAKLYVKIYIYIKNKLCMKGNLTIIHWAAQKCKYMYLKSK